MNGPIRALLAWTAVLSVGIAGAAFADPPDGEKKEQKPAPCKFKGAQRTVTNTDTGVIIEIASDDPAVVEDIQAFHAEFPEGWGKGPGHGGADRGLWMAEVATRTVTNTDNGVRIEISSDDPAVVETIQARAAQGPGMRHGRRPGGWGPCMVEGAERTVTNTDNGVTVQITSDDPEVVAKIQDRAADVQDRPMAGRGPGRGESRGLGRGEGRGEGRGPEAGRKGYRERCGKGHGQKHGQRHGRRHGKRCGCAHHGRPGWIEGAERAVTNTDSGVLIEITSDDPEVVEVIQGRHADRPAKRGQRSR